MCERKGNGWVPVVGERMVGGWEGGWWVVDESCPRIRTHCTIKLGHIELLKAAIERETSYGDLGNTQWHCFCRPPV